MHALQLLVDSIDTRRQRAAITNPMPKPPVAQDVRLLVTHPRHIRELEAWVKSFHDPKRRDWPRIWEAITQLTPSAILRAQAALILESLPCCTPKKTEPPFPSTD